ncbi:MAG: hypothetical protein HY674_22960 [Chloroflexi bacterium]|nr:hypothetical protein [Chloroflexota bacterium]
MHLLVAGLGMYFLCQRWTANSFEAVLSGTAYSFNGLTLNCLMWPNNIAALAWMPWVVWLVADGYRKGGKTLYIAAAVGAIQMLSGAPEVILFTWLLTGALFLIELWRERAAALAMSVRIVGIVGLIALLSAVQLLPFIDLLWHSQRVGTMSYESAMPAWGWANLVTPLFHCYNSGSGVYFQPGQNWTSSYYAGVGTLLLALTALRFGRRPIAPALWAICFIALVFALGKDGWLYQWLRAVFPQLGVMNFPIKFVVPVCFLLPLLAGLGAAAFSQAEHRKGTAGPLGCSVAGRQTWSALTGLLSAIVLILMLLPASMNVTFNPFAN